MTEEEDDEEYDDPKIVKSRMSGFSRAKLEAGRNGLGLCTATESSPKVVAVCFLGFLAELDGVLYLDHVRFHSHIVSGKMLKYVLGNFEVVS